MDVTIELEPQNRWIEVHFSGVMAFSDIRNMGHTLKSRPPLDTDYPRVINYTKVKLKALDFGELSTALLKYGRPRKAELSPKQAIPSAHICCEPRNRALIGFGLKITKDDYPVQGQIFYDQEDAEAWILERIREIPKFTKCY